MNIYIKTLSGSFLLMLSSQLLAHSVNTPHVFTSGTPALASEMNDNFVAVENAVADNDAKIVRLYKSGGVAVHANSFIVPANQTGCSESNSNFLFFSSGSNCDAYTSVSIPSDTIITGLACTVIDKNFNTGAHISITLRRTNSQSGETTSLFAVSPSLNDTNVQRLSANVVVTYPVNNNALYYYKLDADFGTVNGGSSVGLYGCRIGYSYF